MILIIGGTILLMFGLMWWSKRRYGPVALGLVVGLVLADWWASQVALLLDGVGWRLSGLPSRGLAALLLLLLPAGLLLLGGNKYANGDRLCWRPRPWRRFWRRCWCRCWVIN